MPSEMCARVILDSPLPQLDRLFDYSIPDDLSNDISAGVRVTVPLRTAGRICKGFVESITPRPEFTGTLTAIESVVSPIPVLSPEIWALARAVANRACGSAADVLRLAIPARQVRVEKAYLAAQKLPAREHHDTRDERTRRGRPVETPEYDSGKIESVVTSRGRAAVTVNPHLIRASDSDWVGAWAVAMATAATHCLALDRSAILLVPDFRDQEQLLVALAQVIPDRLISRVDARLSNPDRYRAFLLGLGSEPRVVVGNRSAIYAPAARLGLLAMWDDGDPLYSEPNAPYAHARDVALIRQGISNCALLFFAHGRSIETQRLVEIAWLEAVRPPSIAHPRVVPTAQQGSQDPAVQHARIPSLALTTVREALATGPVLVQVARPGYAPGLACARCRLPARCRNCHGPLAVREHGGIPECASCEHPAARWRCESCDEPEFRASSVGATRTAEELGRAFPGVRVVVADGEKPVLTVRADPALVVATRGAEPIALGGYAAVILLDGDRLLSRESLSVAHDCLRLWTNAAALAARNAPVILAGVGGRLATTMVTWRHEDYAREELAERRSLGFPPAVRIATVTGTPESVSDAITSLRDLVETPRVNTVGPTTVAENHERTIVRFDYAAGDEVAKRLRAAVVRNATSRRRVPAEKGGYASPRVLRVKFDDPEAF